MTTPLFTALARNATARAQLIGATGHCSRYWRELASAAHLLGSPWRDAERLGGSVMPRQPSQERGCDGKANLGRRYQANANRLALRHGKCYGVYRCPHCGGTHLTTKLDNAEHYQALLYVTPCPASTT